MHRKRIKKCFLCFLVVLSLTGCNFGLFAFYAHANAWPTGSDIYNAGAPVTVGFSSHSSYGGEGSYFTGSASAVNVYSGVYRSDFDQTEYNWIGRIQSSSNTNVLGFYYSNDPINSANFVCTFQNSRRAVLEFTLDEPIVFTSFDDLNANFNFQIGLSGIRDLYGETTSAMNVRATYQFAAVDSNGITTDTRILDKTVTLTSTSASTNFFHPDVFNSSTLRSVDTFDNSATDSDCYVLLSATMSFLGVCANSFYIEQGRIEPTRYIEYQQFLNLRMLGVMDPDYVNVNVNFEDISWSSWLVKSISGFMDFELVPGLSFAGMLGLLIGMSLFMIFLKIFAGG